MPTITMTINGDLRTLDVAGHRPLLDVLREDLGLTGTKECCAVGECGACTVVVDGMSVNSCLMLAVEADGATVTTVEGLACIERRVIQGIDCFGPKLNGVVFGNSRDLLNTPV